MPVSNPAFAQMVSDIEAGNYQSAAMDAINTPYFAAYLPRVMAKEMQNVSLSDSGVPDNDGSTFVLAHLLKGTNATNQLGGITAGISGIWSDDYTCLVNVAGTDTSAFKLTRGSACRNELVQRDRLQRRPDRQ